LRGFGTAAIIAVCDLARNLACKELWVYTGATDKIAIKKARQSSVVLLDIFHDFFLTKSVDQESATRLAPVPAKSNDK
jgi:hypothetical protein